MQVTAVVGHDRLGHRGECATGSLLLFLQHRQPVHANDHLVAGDGHGTTVCWLQDVVRRQHQHPRLGLGLGRQWQMNGHLVAVEVGVEGCTDERMELDRLALDQLRLEGLDTEAVQGWCTVQQHRVLGDDLLQHIPHDGALPLHHALSGLDVLSVVEIVQAFHHEGFEQFEGHGLRQAALVQLQLGTNHDHRTTRVVDTFAEQVLAEPALLALEHVRDRLQRTVTRPGNRTATAPVVEQRIDGFLEHALLVVDDNLGRAEVEETLQPVVAVDDAAIEVVEVRCCEPTAVKLHHGTQIRRNDWNGIEHHPGRVIVTAEEGGYHLQALQGAGLALSLTVGDDLTQLLGLSLKVEGLETPLNGLGTHVAGEVLAVALLHVPVENLIALQVLHFQRLEPLPHSLGAIDSTLVLVTELPCFLLCSVGDLALDVGLGALRFELGEVLLQLGQAALDLRVPVLLELFDVGLVASLEAREVAVTSLLIHVSDHVRGEIDDLLQILRRDVQQIPEARGDALEVPDVGDGGGQFNVPHPLAAHIGTGHLDAAALTNDALETHPLVLAAVTFPVPGGAEDLLAEEAVTLWFQSAVVDGLGLLDLTVAPLADLVGARQPDAELVVDVHVQHWFSFPRRPGGCLCLKSEVLLVPVTGV